MRKLQRERKFSTHEEEHRRTGQDASPSVTDIQAQLTDLECQLRTLTKEKQELTEKLTQAEAQVYMYL